MCRNLVNGLTLHEARATMHRMAKRVNKKQSSDRHKTPRKNISLELRYHRALELLAEKDGRPITWQLRAMIRKAMEEASLAMPDNATNEDDEDGGD